MVSSACVLNVVLEYDVPVISLSTVPWLSRLLASLVNYLYCLILIALESTSIKLKGWFIHSVNKYFLSVFLKQTLNQLLRIHQ